RRQPGLGAVSPGRPESCRRDAAPRLWRPPRCGDRRASRRGALGDGRSQRSKPHLAGIAQERARQRNAAEDDQAAAAVKRAVWALALLACACAQVELKPPSTVDFDLAGRIAARYGNEAFTGNIGWRHAGGGDELLISTPLGQGVA